MEGEKTTFPENTPSPKPFTAVPEREQRGRGRTKLKRGQGRRACSLEHHSCELRQPTQPCSRPLTDRPLPNEALKRCLSEPSHQDSLRSPQHSVFISLFAVSPLSPSPLALLPFISHCLSLSLSLVPFSAP